MNKLAEQDPAAKALEKNMAALENGRYALAFSSGLSACCAITKLLCPGDHVLVGEDIYGGSYHLIEGVFSPYDISVDYVDTSNLAAIEKAIKANTKLFWLESPSNPLLRLADVEAITGLAKQHKIITVVDNSLATPCLQQPLSLGADIVLHSSTKYLSGRGDIIAGALVTNRLDLFEQMQSERNGWADAVEPIDCFAILKGMRTLADRVRQQEKSARKIANFLAAHLSIEAVYYPGLPSHPQHELACRQMSGFGNVIAFELKGGSEAAIQLLRTVRLTDSTIAHAKIPARVLANSNVGGIKSLVRLTIGLENADDLISDFDTALRAVDNHLIEFPADKKTNMSLQA